MPPQFERLLSPVRVGGLRFKNRIYKPPSGTKLFNNTKGYVSEEGKLIYEAWAKGGAGCIVVESPAIGDERSIDIPNKYLINDDKFIPGLSELVRVIHRHDCPALLQLYHAGQWHLGGLSGLTPVSSSPHPQISELAPVPDLRVLADNPPCEALSLEDIGIIEQQFIDAAERAAKAGFDGLELGAGANHLLASFVSRYWNSRHDEYGCDSYENRARIVVNIIRGIKARLGDDFTVILTINGIENGMGEKGITEAETLELVKLYEEAGADAFQPRVYELYNRASYWTEQYFYPEKRSSVPAGLDFSHRGIGAFTKIGATLKTVTSKPVVIPGKWDSDFGYAEEMLGRGKVDVIAVCRGLFADTDLPVKLKEGRLEDIAPCTACLSCLTGGMLPIRCRINAFIGGKETYNAYPKIQRKKKVLVIGAGPAGLEAARVAALRGHEVVLYSKEPFIGGLMNMASVIKGSYPEDIQQIIEYYKVQLRKLKVKLVKGKEAGLKTVERESPDVVFLATGATVSERPIPGSDQKIVVSDKFLRAGLDLALKVAGPSTLSKATERWMPIGKTVIVMGGDIKAVQLTEFLTKRGRKVTLVCEEDEMQYGEGLPRLNNFKLGEWFKEKGVEIIKGARFEEITKSGLAFSTREGERTVLHADSIVPVYPLKKNEDLYTSLQGKAPEVLAVGACKDPKALIVDAVEDAAKSASST